MAAPNFGGHDSNPPVAPPQLWGHWTLFWPLQTQAVMIRNLLWSLQTYGVMIRTNTKCTLHEHAPIY